MKSTGIVRRLDELGRVVIPIEIRNKFGIVERDPIEIFVDGTNIVLKKFEENCIFCGTTNDLTEYKGKLLCAKCAEQIAKNSSNFNLDDTTGKENEAEKEQ